MDAFVHRNVGHVTVAFSRLKTSSLISVTVPSGFFVPSITVTWLEPTTTPTIDTERIPLVLLLVR